MTDKNDALFLVRLPYGQKTIPYEKVFKLIAMAKSSASAADNEDLIFKLNLNLEKKQLKDAVFRGEVEVLDELFIPFVWPFIGRFEDTVLTVSAFRKYVESIRGFLEVVEAALGDEKQSIERIRYELLASRTQLIEAFSYYGVELKIFKALKDRPGLLAACRVKGKGQKGSRAEPMFCPFEVINWLVKTGVKEKPRLENFMGWHILETKFSSVYAEKSIGDPRQN